MTPLQLFCRSTLQLRVHPRAPRQEVLAPAGGAVQEEVPALRDEGAPGEGHRALSGRKIDTDAIALLRAPIAYFVHFTG